MAAIAPAIQANAAPAAAPAQGVQEGKLNHQKVVELRKFYIGKQKEIELPWVILGGVASLVAFLAIAILGNITSFLAAVATGLWCGIVSMGLTPLILRRVDHSNRDAADALISPGFYEFALRNPRQLANAEQINGAYQRFLAA